MISPIFYFIMFWFFIFVGIGCIIFAWLQFEHDMNNIGFFLLHILGVILILFSIGQLYRMWTFKRDGKTYWFCDV